MNKMILIAIAGIAVFFLYKKKGGKLIWDIETQTTILESKNQKRRKNQLTKKQNKDVESNLKKVGIPSSYIAVTALIVYYACNTFGAGA